MLSLENNVPAEPYVFRHQPEASVIRSESEHGAELPQLLGSAVNSRHEFLHIILQVQSGQNICKDINFLEVLVGGLLGNEKIAVLFFFKFTKALIVFLLI